MHLNFIIITLQLATPWNNHSSANKFLYMHNVFILQFKYCQCLNHRKAIIKLWSFNYLIALEAKCHLCKGSDFIVRFMTCMLKHINATCTMQVFTWITRLILICNCLVISLHSSFKNWLIYLWVNHRYVCRDIVLTCVALHICIVVVLVKLVLLYSIYMYNR